MGAEAPDWYNALPDAVPAPAENPQAQPNQSGQNDLGYKGDIPAITVRPEDIPVQQSDTKAPDWYNALPDAVPIPAAQTQNISNDNSDNGSFFDPKNFFSTKNPMMAESDAMGNMMTFGMGNPAKALAGMAVKTIKGQPASYDEELTNAQRESAEESENSPTATAIGDTLGFLGGAGNAPKAVANAVAPTLFQLAKQGAITGAPIGAISSAANTPGDLQTKAISGGIGGTIGAVLGGATPYAMAGISKLASPITNLVRPLTQSGQENIVGKVLNEATEGRPIMPETAPISGVNLTTGQATNDPGLLWLEKSLQQKNPSGAVQNATTNNQVLSGAAQKAIGNPNLAPDAPLDIQSGLESARDANNQLVKNAWNIAGVNDATPLPTQPLKDDVASHLASLPKADRSAIPNEILSDVGNLEENEPLGEIQSIRSKLDGKVREAYRAGDNNKARILGGLSNIVSEHADNPAIAAQLQATRDAGNLAGNISDTKTLNAVKPDIYQIYTAADERVNQLAPGSYAQQLAQGVRDDALDQLTNAQRGISGLQSDQPQLAENFRNSLGAATGDLDQQQANYQQARAETANFKRNFNQPANVRNVLGVDKYGADKVALSAVPDQFITTGKGAPEKFQSFMNAMRQADPDTQAKTSDAARNYLAGKFFDKVTSVSQDQQGTHILLPNKVSQFMDDYSHVINSPLFSDAQRQTMRDIATSAKMANRTAQFEPPGGGSPTYGYLEQGRFIDAALNGWQKQAFKGASAALGAAAGSHAGPLGTLAGFVGGSKIADGLYKMPQEKTMALLQQAMRDPKLAQVLQMKANKFSEKAMNPAISRYLSQLAIKGGGAVQREVMGQ